MAEGYITIGTELATDKFDKQIVELEKKMEKEEKKKMTIETQLSSQEQELINARKRVDELADAYEKLGQVQKSITSGKATPQQFMIAQDLQNTYGSLDKIGMSFDKALDKQIAIENQIEKTKNQYSDINQKIEEYKRKINSVNIQKQKADVDKLKGSIDNVGNSLKKSVTNAGKLALGIFGIRSAYLALRRASSDLAGYDEQYATNLEYIRFVLTQAIAPILRYIVELAMRLLQYINAIAQAWFGVNLFANGSVEAFNKMKKGATGVGKAVKEIRKQLLGFDEINVLTDQSDTGTSAGASGVTLPNLDLSNLDVETPEWLKWIIEHGEIVRKFIEGIGTALAVLKYGLDLVQGAGLFLVIDGIVELVKDIKDFVNDPSVQKFAEILQDIGLIITGFAIIIGLTSPLGIVLLIIGQIVTMIGGIVGWIESLIKFFKEPTWENYVNTLRNGVKTMGLLGLAIDWLVENVFGGWDKLTKFLETIGSWIDENVIQPIYRKFEPMINFFKKIFDTIWENLKIVIENIKIIIKFAWDKVQEILQPILNFFKSLFSQIWDNIQIVVSNVIAIFNFVKGKVVEIFKPIIEFFSNIFNQAFERVKEVFTPIIDFFKNIFNTILSFAYNIGISVGETIGGAFKSVANAILGAVERILNTPINSINSLIGTLSQIPGVTGLRYLNTFSLPRLKTGGIINMPNSGTLIGGAIAGESGREGVVPLTDRQAMAELGREIGRYITINANITNTMNGRVISRELKQIQNEQDFAYNT